MPFKQALFPPHIFFGTANADSQITPDLRPEEQACLPATASLRRRQIFALGRSAARQALRQAGGETNAPIPIGSRGEPIWPEGFIGSITHSGQVAAALITRTTDYLAVGVDLEAPFHLKNKNQPFRDRSKIASRICHPFELEWIHSDKALADQRTVMLFSAKESIYKAIFPLHKKFFGFNAVAMSWNESSLSFHARLTRDLPPFFFEGFEFQVPTLIEEGWILSFLALPTGVVPTPHKKDYASHS